MLTDGRRAGRTIVRLKRVRGSCGSQRLVSDSVYEISRL